MWESSSLSRFNSKTFQSDKATMHEINGEYKTQNPTMYNINPDISNKFVILNFLFFESLPEDISSLLKITTAASRRQYRFVEVVVLNLGLFGALRLVDLCISSTFIAGGNCQILSSILKYSPFWRVRNGAAAMQFGRNGKRERERDWRKSGVFSVDSNESLKTETCRRCQQLLSNSASTTMPFECLYISSKTHYKFQTSDDQMVISISSSWKTTHHSKDFQRSVQKKRKNWNATPTRWKRMPLRHFLRWCSFRKEMNKSKLWKGKCHGTE